MTPTRKTVYITMFYSLLQNLKKYKNELQLTA